jgi:penicillin-binding protein 1A
MIWLIRFIKLMLLTGFLGLSALVGFYFYVQDELPTEDSIRDVRFQIPMKIYTADGELMSQFGEKRRTPLLHKEIPQQLIDAILATEDSRFYEHYGIDPVGIAVAAFDAIVLGKRARGASTITQQLARNAFLTLDVTVIRKVKELYIALHLEQVLSKEEILTLYLNKAFFGNRAYGVGAAAQVYYGKPINELTLAQHAMIAGLPKAPSRWNPLRNPEKAKQRRNVVLGRMLTVGAITQADYNEAVSQPITAERHGAQITAHAPYVAEQVRKQMVDKYGAEVAYTEGFNVYTTINSKAQLAAQNAVKENIHAYDERHGYRGPVKYLWREVEEQVEKSAEQEFLESQQTDKSEEFNDDFIGTTWSLEQINEYLEKVKNYGDLVPAIVTNVIENTVYVQLKSGVFDVIEWDDLKWARKYESDSEQGPAPKAAIEILQPGALIWLMPKNSGGYRLSQIPEVSGAFIALNPQNGDILAQVGGYYFGHNQYNRVVQAKRQVGSNIKPFLYSAALEKGYTLASIINDAPIHQWDKGLGTAWQPKNADRVYNGPTRMRVGLARSKNVMAVRLTNSIGINNFVEHLTKFGFEQSDLPPNESLSLGSASLTPLSVARGMATFANGGYLVDTQLIDYVKNTAGQEIFRQVKSVAGLDEAENAEELASTQDISFELPAERVISKENAFLISNAMESTINGSITWKNGTGWNGTAWRAQKLKRKDLAGKTGTTNQSVDTWFTGFNQDLLAASWVGFDAPGRALGRTQYNGNLGKNQMHGGEEGSRTALPAWISFMEKILPDYPAKYREIPEGIVSVRIDRETGLLTRKSGYTSRFEYFIRGTEPQDYIDSARADFNKENDVIEEEEEIFE